MIRLILGGAALLFGALVVVYAVHEPSPEEFGWIFVDSKDPMTDAEIHSAVRRGEGGTLTIRCFHDGSGQKFASIRFDDYLGQKSGRTIALQLVETRFDAASPMALNAYYMNEDIAFLDYDNADAVLTDLQQSSRVAFQADDYRGVPHVMTVDLPLRKTVFEHLDKACPQAAATLETVRDKLQSQVSADARRF